ncbi:MAG: hypothetical protein ACE5IY_23630 [bacterium]
MNNFHSWSDSIRLVIYIFVTSFGQTGLPIGFNTAVYCEGTKLSNQS